jgi:ApaG protein
MWRLAAGTPTDAAISLSRRFSSPDIEFRERDAGSNTKDIRVHVESEFAPGRSNPPQNQWFFYYTIRIINEGRQTVQSAEPALGDHRRDGRHEGSARSWRRRQAAAARAGQSFEYTSGCDLTTPFGSMRGTYQMINDRQEHFDIEIPMFTLTEPYTTVH